MVTAALFVIGKFLIGLYLGHTSAASAYGVAGSLALLLLWTYYSSMIFLLGAEFTQVWARAHGKRIQPSGGAIRVEKKETPREERPAA
jgi:membrane protein